MLTTFGSISIQSNDQQLINNIRIHAGKIQNRNCYTLQETETNTILIIDQQSKHKKEAKAYNISTLIHIIEDKSYENIANTYQLGADYVLEHPINKNHLKYLIEKSYSNNVHTCITNYKGLLIDNKQESIIYKECKIFLTHTEFNFITNIIYNKEIYNSSKKSHQVLVSRINKKTKNSTGLSLIKSRYGFGYTITI